MIAVFYAEQDRMGIRLLVQSGSNRLIFHTALLPHHKYLHKNPLNLRSPLVLWLCYFDSLKMAFVDVVCRCDAGGAHPTSPSDKLLNAPDRAITPENLKVVSGAEAMPRTGREVWAERGGLRVTCVGKFRPLGSSV